MILKLKILFINGNQPLNYNKLLGNNNQKIMIADAIFLMLYLKGKAHVG